jgi:hypothetical protein
VTRTYFADSGSGSSTADVPTVRPETFRLPSGRERDPYFGLGRSYWNLMILPNPANNFTPNVRSYVLRKQGSKRGLRLIDYASARSYIMRHEDVGESQEPDHQDLGTVTELKA